MGAARSLKGAKGPGAYVSDIFHEVDEEVRRERFQKLWDRWGNYILAAAVLLVIAVAGWRAWDWYETKKAHEAGTAFESALDLAKSGKHDEAETAFAKVAKDSPSGYRALARFREASELAVRDPAAAVKAYDIMAADSSMGRVLQDLAAVRAALLLVDSAPLAEIQSRLEPLTAADRPFRHSARELLALSAWRSGDKAAAKRWFDMIVTDADTPSGTRSRIDMLIALSDESGKG
jgi:hypothetical protein